MNKVVRLQGQLVPLAPAAQSSSPVTLPAEDLRDAIQDLTEFMRLIMDSNHETVGAIANMLARSQAEQNKVSTISSSR